jgi:CheY-like chemotaxis protein
MTPKVLIVDDDPLIHQLYRRHIEGAGFQLLSAMDGRQATELAEREVPQIIVMDIMMPEMDGLTAVLGLKKKQETQSIPIIMITANPMYHLCQRESEWAGAAVFLTKPFSPARLIEEIRRLLSGQTPSASVNT